MMGWYGAGWGGLAPLMWVCMGLFWLGLIVLIVWLVTRLLPGSRYGGAPPTGQGQAESPEQVLDRLFAMGEIDEQTYRSRRTALGEMRRKS